MFQIKFTVQSEELVIQLESTTEEEEMLHTTDKITQRVLVAKDSGLISDEAFHELRMSLPEETRTVIPPINALLIFFVALVYHVPQFLEKCGSLSNLNCQP